VESGEEMTMKSLGRIFCSTLLISSLTLPAFALDYEAKPVAWVLAAPFRTAGGLVGGVFSGAVSGPLDHSYHDAVKFETKAAGNFGDERGALQRTVSAPVAVPAGLAVGGVVGVPKGFVHGFQLGWKKPLSRWSFITMEEK
jgi:hypothetical protein